MTSTRNSLEGLADSIFYARNDYDNENADPSDRAIVGRARQYRGYERHTWIDDMTADIQSGGGTAALGADEICARAVQLQVANELDGAERLYEDVLRRRPDHDAAHYCLGMLRIQRRDLATGIAHLLKALDFKPEVPDYWLGYLEALLMLERTEDATQTLALARRHGLEGTAVEEFARRLDAKCASGRAVCAPVTGARAARRRQPRELRRDVGKLESLLLRKRTPEARALAESMVNRYPDSGFAWKVHGTYLWADGRVEEAANAFTNCVRVSPEDVEAHIKLGMVALDFLKRLDVAITHLRRAMRLDPECKTPLANAGHTALLFAICHDPEMDAETLYQEHLRIGRRLERRSRNKLSQHRNDRTPERRLRIGFVSGDLRNHAVAHFFEPVLNHLAGAPALELFAYYTGTVEDAVSQRMRSKVHHWHKALATQVSDDQLARKIREDGIDILVDLSGHTSENRLGTFAQKPAPLQVSWLGYVGTTGLQAMDYYLTDRHYLPRDQFERHFTEKLVYLPAMAPFQPELTAPPVNELPALASGTLCFGSFHRVSKINPATVAVWSALLRALPHARLLLAAMPAGPQGEQIIAEFTRHGIGRERLLIHPLCGMSEYLGLHHQVDICLDTQPWSGGTTTNHAFWMGVPTLTRVGTTPASRLTAALSHQVGLEAFVAESDADLVARGVYWAEHLTELAGIRRGLRERCLQSPVRQPAIIGTAIERAFRHMWERWCAGREPASFAVDDLTAPSDASRTESAK